MIAAAPPVELADVGGLACLYRGDTGALSILTPAARAVWLRMGAAEGTPDASLLDIWRAQGFLDARDAADAVEGTAGAGSSTIPLLDRCYALTPGRACRLTVDAEPLAGLLSAVLEPVACNEAVPIGSVVDVLTASDATEVRVDGLAVFRGAIAPARSETLRQLLLGLVGREMIGALLHASTVAGPGGAVALLGQSGSGKSTLAAELVAEGWAYIADDVSALDRSANAIHPFPLGLSVKSGSAGLVARRFPALRDLIELTTRRLRVRYLDLKAFAAPSGRPSPLAALVFPIFDAGVTGIEAERLSPEATLQLAIDSGTVPDGEPRSIRPLARLCNEVPAWHLAYSDVAAASAWVRALRSDTP
jgi:hypothetical protein